MWDDVFEEYGKDADKVRKAFQTIRRYLEEPSKGQILQNLMEAYRPDILLSSLILEASDGRCIEPMVLRGSRTELGLTVAQMASLLETDQQTIRRMEQTPIASTFRKPARRMVRLLRAYLSGYRPTDWPVIQGCAK